MQTPAAATDLAGAARSGQPQNHRGVPLPRKVVMVAKRPDFPPWWRRRESNPRPRTHRSERLQA